MAENRLLFLRSQCDNDTGHKWVCFSDNTPAGELLMPIHGMSHSFPAWTLATSMGHRIYIMGGNIHPPGLVLTSEFWYTGVYLNDDGVFFGTGWRQGPNMLIPRCNTPYPGSATAFMHEPGLESAIGVPHTVVVFRGTRNNQLPWAEYFDSTTTTWSPIPPPLAESWRLNTPREGSFDVFTGPSSAFDPVQRLIFLLLRWPRFLYSFDIRPQPNPIYSNYDFARDVSERWSVLNDDFGNDFAKMVLSGDSLYLLKKETIFRGGRYSIKACHIGPESRGLYIDPIAFDNDLFPSNMLVDDKHIHFVAMDNNGKLCVVWQLPDEDQTFGVLRVQCLTLVVHSNINENGVLVFAAQLESDRVFELDTGEELVDCLVVEPCQEAPAGWRDGL